MLKINKKVEYALIALKFMAQKPMDQLTSAREICDEIGTPFDTTAKVMQAMNTHGLLQSVKGIKGGYRLAMPLKEVSYITLVELIEGKRPDSVCQNHKGVCELSGTCNIITPIDQLNRKLTGFLETLNLEDLLLGNLQTHTNTMKLPLSAHKETHS